MIRNQALRKIDKRIYLVFIALIAITLINALISTVTIRRSQTITSDIVYNTNPSLNALSRMNLLVTRSRMLITNWVYLPHGTQDRNELQAINTHEYVLLRGTLTGLMHHWADTSETNAMAGVFSDYEKLAQHENTILNLLYNFDDFRDPVRKFQAEEILEREIIPLAEKLTREVEKITESQTRMALKKQDNMLYRFNSLMVLILGFAVLIICSVLFATLILSRSIIVPVLHIRNLIMQMGRGELPEMKMRAPDNAVGEMSQALGFMIDGFRQQSRFVEEIGKGNFDSPYEPLSNKDVQGHALITMRDRLKQAAEEDARRMWMAEGLALLNETMRSSNEDFTQLLNRTIDIIVSHLKVEQAAIFLLNNDDLDDMHIQLGAYYALNNRLLNSKRYELKEGLIGQAVASNRVIVLENTFDPYFTIDTGFGDSPTCNIMIIPLTTSGKVVGALEIASTNTLRPEQKELLQRMAEPIAASLFSVRANLITSQLLEESRKQAEELASQEQELKGMNIKLHEKARLLEQQNLALEDIRLSLSFKATQLEESNKYKSAFLANMSHELRTPLNSILILARLLADNKAKNLSAREIEHAQVIHKSGSDLLNLINDILDLSKIEAGKVELMNEELHLNQFNEEMYLLFREVAADRKINFACNRPEYEVTLVADQVRLAQVIKNLLSNAFKFTPEGGRVVCEYGYAGKDTIYNTKELLQSDKVVFLKISDTGIGIPEDKQKLIFEAFQQADGSTSRRFGGTGLGLSITRELISIMGGEIHLQSRENEGSTFTIYLPAEAENTSSVIAAESDQKDNSILDDSHLVHKGDGSILIIEDDYVFAKMLMNQCHRYDCKAIIALDGEKGLQYAREYHPRSIVLDLRMPVMDGWSVLKQLKDDPQCRHIPVHIITAVDKMALGLEMGAESYLQKPIDQHTMDKLFGRILHQQSQRRYLYTGGATSEFELIRQCADSTDDEILVSDAGEIGLLHTGGFDCILVGSNTGTAEVETIRKTAEELNIPLVYVDGKPDECLVAAKGIVSQADQHLSLKQSENTVFVNTALKDKVVLLVDDDMRNIYSITHILEEEGMQVISAFDGRDALEKLAMHAEVEIVLMDIMMPNMNGLEAIEAIRQQSKWMKLPVIAVTAKAMGGDRETCINAGASDYLTKPIQVDQLVNLLKVWLHK